MYQETGFPDCCGADVIFDISRITIREASRIKKHIIAEGRKAFLITAHYQTDAIRRLSKAGWVKVGRKWVNADSENTLQMWASH